MPDFVKFIGLAAIFMLLIIFTWLLQLYALGIYFTIANELGINDRNGGTRSIEELLLNPMPEVTEADEQLIPSWLMDSSRPYDEFETSSSDSSPSSSEGEFLLRGPFENDNVISAPDPSPDPSLDGVPPLLNPQGTNENITDVSFEYLNDETGSAQRAYMNLIYDDASLEIWAYQTQEFSAPENNTASEQSDINNENARVAMSWFMWSNGTSLPHTLLPQTIPSSDDGMSFSNPLDGTLGETNSGTSNVEEQDDMNQHIEENASVPDVNLRGDSGGEVIDAETGAQLAIQLALQLIFMYIIMMRNNMEENRALCQLNDLDLDSEPEQEVDLSLEDNTLAGLDSSNDEMESNVGRDSPPLSWFNFVTEEIPEVQPEYYMFQYFDEEFDNDNLDSNCMNEPNVLDIEDPDDQPEELVEEWENNNSDEDTVACQCQGACACPHDDEWETISSSSRYSGDSPTSAESSRTNSLTTASRPDILQNLPERSCEEQENTEELEGSDESDLDALDLTSVCKNFYLNHMEIHEESAQSYLTEAMENHLIDFEGINILQLAVVYIKLVYSARRLARLVLYNVSTDLFSNFECGSALLEFQTMFNRIVDNEAIHNPEGAMMLAEIYHMCLSRARILERCQGTWVEDLINILSDIYGHQSTLTVDFYAREFQEQECLLIAELFVNISSCLSGCLEFGQTVLAILAASFRYWVPNGFNVLLDGVDSEDGEHDGTVAETDDSGFCQFNTEGNFENAISFVTEDQEAIVMTKNGEIERGEGNHEDKSGELEKPKDETEDTNEYEEDGDQEVEEEEEEVEEVEEEEEEGDDDEVVEENEKYNDDENEGSSLEGNIEDAPRGSISPSVSKN